MNDGSLDDKAELPALDDRTPVVDRTTIEFTPLFHERRRDVRAIRIFEHISLDGVIQAPGGPGEDGDYQHGGWTVPFADPAIGQTITATHSKRFDLLLGRRTYDIWAGYWPKVRAGPLADRFNAATKYVATH